MIKIEKYIHNLRLDGIKVQTSQLLVVTGFFLFFELFCATKSHYIYRNLQSHGGSPLVHWRGDSDLLES